MWVIFDAVVFLAGFWACWYLKDKLVELVTGAEAFARSLESKASSLKERL
jgi:hypothetical protein